MQHKIPAFLTKEFGSKKTKEDKDRLLEQYRIWKSNDITELFTEYLEYELEVVSYSNDKKFDFVSWFQKKEYSSFYKGSREILRKIIKQIGA